MKLTLRMIFRRSAPLLILFWITSCANSKLTSTTSSQNTAVIKSPQVIFLNYSFWKDQDKTYHIELINETVTGGQIKDPSGHHTESREGDLKCLTLDQNRAPIFTVIVPDPLVKRVEVPQEDGTLTSKVVELDSAVFSVRMPLDPSSRFIAVERISPSDSSFLFVTEIR